MMSNERHSCTVVVADAAAVAGGGLRNSGYLSILFWEDADNSNGYFVVNIRQQYRYQIPLI